MNIHPKVSQAEIKITLENIELGGFLDIPDHAKGMVVFVHGNGSSRFSNRNHAVAEYLFQRNMGTLLFVFLII